MNDQLDQREWESTEFLNVYRDKKTNRYAYNDVPFQEMSTRMYDSAELADQGMHDYVTFSLDGPEKLQELKLLLDVTPGIDVYTCVHIAKKAFAEFRGEDALLALRQDADKLLLHSERLYALVINKKMTTQEKTNG